jgi:hypothetical protein
MQDQSCVSKRTLQDKGHDPEKSVLGSSPGEDGFCISVAKLIEKRNQENFFFGGENTGAKVIKPKLTRV